MTSKKMIQIAIDGPAASGKSTAARTLAERLGGYYVNTGDMYRTVAWAALQAGIDPDADPGAVVAKLPEWDLRLQAEGGVLQLILNDVPVQQAAIRAPEVAAVVSQVARIPEVRDWMLSRQRDCRHLGIIIMEGRDIGTVVLPDATCKFFITASPEERARRRLQQAGEVAPSATLASVAADIAERDRIDSTRAVAPLKPADDAEIFVTDGMEKEEVAELLIAAIKRKTGL
ncbi:MAG TPA: (d)CMP kinase [Lentisphaeria bacterium]|nr:(d)CMP kinase [Lentisphaeria bacterium]